MGDKTLHGELQRNEHDSKKIKFQHLLKQLENPRDTKKIENNNRNWMDTGCEES